MSTADLSTGPKDPRSTVLSQEEATIVFRKPTLLALDDWLNAPAGIPHLTRSSRHCEAAADGRRQPSLSDWLLAPGRRHMRSRRARQRLVTFQIAPVSAGQISEASAFLAQTLVLSYL